jgi:hypothetical protein
MKTEVRIYYSYNTPPNEVYNLKVALKRKGVDKAVFVSHPDDISASKDVAMIKVLLAEQIARKGYVFEDLSQMVMTCGNQPDNLPAPLIAVPISEIYIGYKNILAVL